MDRQGVVLIPTATSAVAFTPIEEAPTIGFRRRYAQLLGGALLRDTQTLIAVVADQVGYTSEAAFSRAFRNRYGTPPARWRREARTSDVEQM